MDIEKARIFCKEVKKLGRQFNLNFFFLTEGASVTSNNGNPAIRHARKCHEEWERQNGFDPDEEWSIESVVKLMYRGAHSRATIVDMKDYHKSHVALMLDQNTEYHMKLNSEFQRYIADNIIDYHQAGIDQLNDKNNKVAVATSYNGILGYIMYRNNGDCIDIRDFYVNQHYRGEGIGTKLMDYILENRGKKPIKLRCMKENKSGYKFYVHYGFKLDKIEQGKEYKINDYIFVYN